MFVKTRLLENSYVKNRLDSPRPTLYNLNHSEVVRD